MRSQVRKGQRYLTVVVDHDTGWLVWAGPSREKATVRKFLDLLSKDRVEGRRVWLRAGAMALLAVIVIAAGLAVFARS